VSVQPELTDPRISAFLASDPNLRSPVLAAPTPPPKEDDSHLTEIAIGISAAFIAWRMIMRHRLQQEHPRSEAEARNVTLRVIKSLSKAWESMSLPPIKQAYSVVPYKAVETLAIDYATELGQYINDTSVDALLEGFSSQINAGIGEGLAWDRAVNGYGLDPRQMKTYISGLLVAEKPRYGQPAVAPNVQASLDRAILTRADRLGMNESYKAVQVGKNMTWMAMQAGGDLPEGTKKKWITANDERVCEVCGPLDGKTIPLHWRFKAINGEKFYAPGVHPKCRCGMELVYPQFDDIVKALGSDKYNRDEDGQFAVDEERAQLGGAKFAAQSRTGAKFSEKKTKWARNNARIGVYPGAKFDVGAANFGRQGAKFAGQYRELAEDLDAAVNDPIEDDEDWHYDTVVYVPATKFWKASFEKKNKVWNPNLLATWGGAVGQEVTLNAKRRLKNGDIVEGLRGHISDDPRPNLYESWAFLDAFVSDSRAAAVTPLSLNEAADAPGGGRAKKERIAIYNSNENLKDYRNALDGLNRRQLLYLMAEALRAPDADSETSDFIAPHGGMTNEEIIDYYDTKDVNDIATEMLMAYESEDYNRMNGADAAHSWEDVMDMALKAHKEGWLAKRQAFRDVGAPDFHTSQPIIFRIANGWHGANSYERKNRDDTANVDGRYVIASVSRVKPPKEAMLGIGYPIGTPERLAREVIIVDLAPQHIGLYDEKKQLRSLNLFQYV
jgi:hypothetical protein